MYEIRIHGRGGQGAVLAGGILATALVLEGKFVVAVPSFGFERRGAPVASYLRFDEREIRQMTNIYHPDCVLCIDPTVARAVNVFEGIKDGAVLVQTTAKPLGDFELPREVATVGLCDAVSIALDIFKRSITNTIMLGAFARTTGLVSLDSLRAAIQKSDFRDAGLKQNMAALERGYESTQVHQIGKKGGGMKHQAYKMFDASTIPDDLCPIATKPTPMLPGDWRSMRPVVDRAKCVKCAVCWLYCPVQCVVERPAWFDFNLKTCKGCGICATECPQRAIAMIEEAA